MIKILPAGDVHFVFFFVPTGRVMAPVTGTIHVILAVTDHGTPRLTRCQRVIVSEGK